MGEAESVNGVKGHGTQIRHAQAPTLHPEIIGVKLDIGIGN